MNRSTNPGSAIATMPRGGPNATWLDRHLEADEPEYLDRDDVPDKTKQAVITWLDRLGTRFDLHEKSARIALDTIADVPHPRILELGAGHGRLSEKILELHPSATVTVSDRDPTSVANIAAGGLGSHPRATVQVVDAASIDADDDSYDLVVFAQSFHHLAPSVAYRAIAEATRVGGWFLVIDLVRRKPLTLLAYSLANPPLHLLLWWWPSLQALIHDGYISALRAYSPAALQALALAADPAMKLEYRKPPTGLGPRSFAALFTRPRTDRG